MSLDVVVGLQRGDEGKGRFVDLVAGDYAIIARGNGGSNAGHTVMPDTLEPLALHQEFVRPILLPLEFHQSRATCRYLTYTSPLSAFQISNPAEWKDMV